MTQTNTMTKKDYLLHVIDLVPQWEKWWALRSMILKNQLSPKDFEKIYGIFNRNLATTYNKISKIKKETYETMKLEKQWADKQDVSNIDSMFDDL